MSQGWARNILGLMLAAGLLVSAPTARAEGAGGLQVSPIRLDLGTARRGGALTLSNTSSQRKTIQVEILAWSQIDSADDYQATRALLANPPLFFLEPGASQVVRVGLPAAAPAGVAAEQAFRVFLSEVPDEHPSDSSVLRVAVRLGIPIFVTPTAAIAPKLQWDGCIHPDGSISLTLTNGGSAHARAADLHLLAATGAEILAGDPTMYYVLAGSRQTWKLRPAHKLAPGPARISALMEDGVREFPIVLHSD